MGHSEKNLIYLELIGRGGMGEVYRARKTGPGGFEKEVAVKKLLPAYSEDPEFTKMFLNEAKLTAKLTHPNIAQIYDVGIDDTGHLFQVLELISGKSLREVMDRTTECGFEIPIPIACLLAEQVALGIAYAHQFIDPATQLPARIIHRDLTPHNIMLSADGQVKILDFGIAKSLGTTREVTASEGFKGKLPYLSPEMIKGLEVDERSDLFSLGIILFELLTSQRLFKGKSDWETIEKIKGAHVPSIHTLRKAIPAELDSLLQKCLAVSPSDRPRSAGDLAKELRDIIGTLRNSVDDSLKEFYQELNSLPKVRDQTVSDHPRIQPRLPSVPEKGPTLRSKSRVAWTVVLLVAAVLGGVYFAKKDGGPPKTSKDPAETDEIIRGEEFQISSLTDRGEVSLLPPAQNYTDIAEIAPTTLNKSACYWAGIQLSATATLLFDPELEGKWAQSQKRIQQDAVMASAQRAKTPAQVYRLLFGAIRENADKASKLTSLCDYSPRFHAVIKVIQDAVQATQKVSIGDSDSYGSIWQKLRSVQGLQLHQWKAALAPPSAEVLTEIERWLGNSHEHTMPYSVYETAPALGINLVKFDPKISELSGTDCRVLGDLLFVKNLVDTNVQHPADHLNYYRALFVTGTDRFELRGFAKSKLVLAALDAQGQDFGKSGFCLYIRKNMRLQAVKAWSPKQVSKKGK